MSHLQSIYNTDFNSEGNIVALLELFIDYVIEKSDSITLEQKTNFIEWLLQEKEIGDICFQKSMKKMLDPILPILLKSKDNMKFADESHHTILHHFLMEYVDENLHSTAFNISVKQSTVIEYLIKNGACILALDSKMNTPLSIVIKKKRIDLMPAMMIHVNVSNAHEETVFHILIDRYVIDDNNYQNYSDFTQFFYNLLSNHGLSLINKKEHTGMTAAHFAAKHCYIEILQMLKEKGANLNLKTNCGDDLLISLCKNIRELKHTTLALLKTLEWLSEQGFNANSQNEAGYTPLHYAAGSHKLDAVKTLVKAGADVNAIADDNMSPLHCAVMMGSDEIIKYLIECGTTIPKKEVAYGFTLLHLAACSHDKSKLRWVIRNGFNMVDICGDDDITPLHLAAAMGNTEIVQELITHKANVHCQTKSGQYTPLHLASMSGNLKNIDIEIFNGNKLQRQENIVRVYFHRLCNNYCNYYATIYKLLQVGCDVNVKDNSRRMPLHFATQQQDHCITLQLLEAGAYVDTQDSNGLLPLHNVLENGSLTGLHRLLSFGADINELEIPYPNTFVELKLCKPKLACHVIYHAVKLKALGLPVSNVYKPYLHDNEMKLYHENCLKEIVKLKSHILTNNISVYNFLHMSFKKQSTFISSLSFDVENAFPIYHTVIRGSFRKAQDRQLLQQTAKLAINQVTEIDWPDLCNDHIFSYLSNRNLRALIESMYIEKNSLKVCN